MDGYRTKNFIYKMARFSKVRLQTDPRLQDLIKMAFDQQSRASLRLYCPDNNDLHYFVVSSHELLHGMLCGIFFNFTKGNHQPAFLLDSDSPEFEIVPMEPEEQTEFLENILYFCIYNNHVVVLQAGGLRAKQFETYLNWLLKEKCQLVDPDDEIFLANQPQPERRRRVQDVKQIEFSTPVDFAPASQRQSTSTSVQAEATSIAQTTENINVTPTGRGRVLFDALREFLDLPDQFRQSQVLEDKPLKIKMTVSWERTRQEDPSDLMDIIGAQLRHADDLEYTIHTKGGDSLSSTDFKRMQPHSVRCKDGLPYLDDLFEKMTHWLTVLMRSDQVFTDR